MAALGERAEGAGAPGGGAPGQPPSVVALPAEEALAVLRSAGWERAEVSFTRAPARGRGQGAVEPRAPAPGPGGAETYVVRQRLVDGVVHLTVAEHPGGPWAVAARPAGPGGMEGDG